MEQNNEQSMMQVRVALSKSIETIGKWYNFFAVVTVVSAALMVIGALLIFALGSVTVFSYDSYGYAADTQVSPIFWHFVI